MRLLTRNPPLPVVDELSEREMEWFYGITKWVLCVAVVLIVGCNVKPAHAYTEDQIVSAIGKAENSKTHPYGIMTKYKHTSPRQACLNTVRHIYRLWIKQGRQGDFVAFLGHVYAPLGVTNDPQGLNRNWIGLVHYFLGRV